MVLITIWTELSEEDNSWFGFRYLSGYAVLNGRVPIGWLGQNPPRESRHTHAHTLRSERQVKVSYLYTVLAKRYRLKWWFVFVGNVGYTDTLHPAWQRRCIGEHITSFTTREWTSIISCHTSWQHGNVSVRFDSSVSSLALVAAGVVLHWADPGSTHRDSYLTRYDQQKSDL